MGWAPQNCIKLFGEFWMTNYQNLGCPIFTQTRTESPLLEEVGVVPKQPSTGGLPDFLPACRPLLKNSAKIKRGAGSANPLGSVRSKGAWSVPRAVANLAAVEDRMSFGLQGHSFTTSDLGKLHSDGENQARDALLIVSSPSTHFEIWNCMDAPDTLIYP